MSLFCFTGPAVIMTAPIWKLIWTCRACSTYFCLLEYVSVTVATADDSTAQSLIRNLIDRQAP